MSNITAIIDNGHNGKFSFCLAKVVERLASAPLSTDVVGSITIISFPSRVDTIFERLVNLTGAGDRETFASMVKGLGHKLNVMSITNDPTMWSKDSIRDLLKLETQLPSLVILDGASTEFLELAEGALSEINGDVYVTARMFLGPGEPGSLPGPDILTEPAEIFDKAARVIITGVQNAVIYGKTMKAPGTDGGMPIFSCTSGSLRVSSEEEARGAFEWYYRGQYDQEPARNIFPKINVTVIKGRGNSRKTSFAIAKVMAKLLASTYQEKPRRLVVLSYENAVEEMLAIIKNIGDITTHDVQGLLQDHNITLHVGSLQHDASVVDLLKKLSGTNEEVTLVLDGPPSFFTVMNAKRTLERCGGEMYVVAHCSRGFSMVRGFDATVVAMTPPIPDDLYQDAWISGVTGDQTFFRKIKSSDPTETVDLVMHFRPPFIVQSTAEAAADAFNWHDIIGG